MKRAILTGGTGFVGAGLARRLARDGHEVHLLVRSAHQSWRVEEIRAVVRLHEVELSDADAVMRIIARIRPDWVFHLAAHGAYSWQNDLEQMVQTNIRGTINLVQASLAAGVEAFINTGSSSEYGFKDHAPDETEWLEPNSHYAVTKAAATLFCRQMAQSQNAPLTTLRLYSVYGPYEEPNRLMPALAVKGLRGELPPLVSPDIARDYVHVEDACDAYLLAAARAGETPGAVYNVGTGIQTSLGELVDMARRVLDIPAEPQWGSMPARRWDTSLWRANADKIRDELGWEPRRTIEDGFRDLAHWLRDNESWLAFYEGRMARPGH